MLEGVPGAREYSTKQKLTSGAVEGRSASALLEVLEDMNEQLGEAKFFHDLLNRPSFTVGVAPFNCSYDRVDPGYPLSTQRMSGSCIYLHESQCNMNAFFAGNSPRRLQSCMVSNLSS